MDRRNGATDRPQMNPNWTTAMARTWCQWHRLSDCVAQALADVVLRFGIRDGESLERQLRIRGVDLPRGYTQVIERFVDYADACVREAGWNWVWRVGVVPPYPIGTLLDQGLIIGIDDLEPATYRVCADGIPLDLDMQTSSGGPTVICTTPHDRAMACRRVADSRVALIRFEDAEPLVAEGFLLV